MTHAQLREQKAKSEVEKTEAVESETLAQATPVKPKSAQIPTPIGMPDPDAPVIMTKIVPFESMAALKKTEEVPVSKTSEQKPSMEKPLVEKLPESKPAEKVTEKIAEDLKPIVKDANMLIPYDHGKHQRGFTYSDNLDGGHMIPFDHGKTQRGFQYGGHGDYSMSDHSVSWNDFHDVGNG